MAQCHAVCFTASDWPQESSVLARLYIQTSPMIRKLCCFWQGEKLCMSFKAQTISDLTWKIKIHIKYYTGILQSLLLPHHSRSCKHRRIKLACSTPVLPRSSDLSFQLFCDVHLDSVLEKTIHSLVPGPASLISLHPHTSSQLKAISFYDSSISSQNPPASPTLSFCRHIGHLGSTGIGSTKPRSYSNPKREQEKNKNTEMKVSYDIMGSPRPRPDSL